MVQAYLNSAVASVGIQIEGVIAGAVEVANLSPGADVIGPGFNIRAGEIG